MDKDRGGRILIKALVFPVTYRCNAKCIMCSIHKRYTTDKNISFFENFFKNESLAYLESINITGGEPTLRKDLPELIKMITKYCTRLSEININSNGIKKERIIKTIENILNNIDPRIKLQVFISLDRLDMGADDIRGIKNSSALAQDSLMALKELQNKYQNLSVGISCTIISKNIDVLEDMYEYSKNNNFLIDFIYATVNDNYINSVTMKDQFVLSSHEINRLIKFIEELMCYEEFKYRNSYYIDLINVLKGKSSTKKCIFREGKGLLLEADGRVSVCGMTAESFLGHLTQESADNILCKPIPNIDWKCKTCETNSYVEWSTESKATIKNELFEKVKIKRNS